MDHHGSVIFNGIDSLTPVNQRLCGRYLKSFAYYTIKERLPVILTVVLDSLVRNKSEITKWEESAEADLKNCIGKLAKLKNEIQTNKIFIQVNGKGEYIKVWNDHLESLKKSSDPTSWFDSPWLLSECYMYRRLQSIFEESKILSNHDCFSYQKKESFEKSAPDIKALGRYALEVLENCELRKKEYFINLVKFALWGNRCDLSIGELCVFGKEKLATDRVKALDRYLLHDDSRELYALMTEYGIHDFVIDYVLDNAGFELFCDLCFCDFLCSCSLASKVRFHVKKHPWYVSDATANDFKELICKIRGLGLDKLANRWEAYLSKDIWSIHDEGFWTTPFSYPEMVTRDPTLYQLLCQANLVIFKGDLNYRKLLGDVNWKHSEKLDSVLGRFRPANILALRTIKSDIVCGVVPSKTKELPSDLLWMRTGEFAVIQKWSAYS
ncbi:UNVERIFIED_CONTAM: hypothetical protein PYX00_006816 [Menopon gallinae]|uniref:Sugar phosphate phosphatase n=1 Tax=Menopon gallinae TaxID=328185 RepID=A0AAW2HY92_9NEOP